MSSTESCKSFNAPPVAPVFWMTVSIPSSTCFQAAIDAVASPAIGSVKLLVISSPIGFSDWLIPLIAFVNEPRNDFPVFLPALSPALGVSFPKASEIAFPIPSVVGISRT